jgi:hypothetical protein
MTGAPDVPALTDAEGLAFNRLQDGEVATFDVAGERPRIRARVLQHWALRSLPRGIRLRGVRVEGALDLTDAALPALVLEGCELPDRVDVSHARVGHVSIRGSRFTHLAACSARIDTGFEFGSTRAFAGEAWVDAGRATIRGGIDSCGAQLKAPPPRARDEVMPWDHRYALRLSETEIQGNVLLNGGFVADGGLCLDDAHVRGSVWARGATLVAGEGDDFHPGDALHAHTAKIDGFVGLVFGFRARGRVWMLGAKIGDRLSVGFQQSELHRVGETWDWGNRLLNATVLLVIEQAEIGGSFHFSDCTADGAINMAHARIGADATFANCVIRNATDDGQGLAISARSAEVRGSFVLGRSVDAQGMVSLAGARIGGRLDWRGARLSNPGADGAGVALDARWARIGQDVSPGELQGPAVQGRVLLEHARVDEGPWPAQAGRRSRSAKTSSAAGNAPTPARVPQ